jgi:hypothetical protein
MFFAEVIMYIPKTSTQLHAHPADIRFAASAGDLHATFSFHDVYAAFRTRPHIILFPPFLIGINFFFPYYGVFFASPHGVCVLAARGVDLAGAGVASLDLGG